MSEEKPEKPKHRVLFRLLKGFVYGTTIGLFSGSAIYLLADAVSQIAQLPIPAGVFGYLIFAASTVSGIAHEYSTWLESQG